MIRYDEKTWIKCGTELFDDKLYIAAVYTNDFSDWNILPVTNKKEEPYTLWIRIERELDTITVLYKTQDTDEFSMLRLGHLDIVKDNKMLPVHAGIMLASPVGPGFQVKFTDFELR
jgi:regulation of enolase protein 1 (concanavalin A-like superfamily)